MKISLATNELSQALAVVNRGLSSRTTLPILAGILFVAEKGKVTLHATDLDVSVRTSVDARVDEEGSMVLPGRLTTDIVKNLQEGAVTIFGDKGSAVVVCGRSSFTVKTLSADEFPHFPEMQPDKEAMIDGTTFAGMVQKVAKAVSKDETRPVLTGILVEMKKGSLTMVATDSYRLCVVEAPIGQAEEFSAVIPGRAMEDVAKLIGDQDNVKVASSQNQIAFTFGSSLFVTRRIEGVFPNYQQLLPSEYETRLVVDREELLSAVKRVSLMAQHAAPLRIAVDPGERTAILSAQTHDVGDAKEVLEADIEGQAVEIAFNHAYLADGIAAADSERVAIEITSPMKPGVIRNEDDGRYTYLLMPVRL